MKKFFYGMLAMYFLDRITAWWGRIFIAVFGTPAIKSAVSGATASVIDKAVFGDRPVPSRTYSATRYDRPPVSSDVKRERWNSPSSFDSTYVVFENNSEVLELMEQLRKIQAKFNCVTLADFYELIGAQPTFVDNQYGWDESNNLIGKQEMKPVRGGFVLVLPKPKYLRSEKE